MIKNIVFDMGKVLVGYDGSLVCSHYIEDPEDQKTVFQAVFVSPEWVYLDMGVMSEEQAMTQICARLPERLHEAARLCMRDWDKYNMWTIKAMDPVIRALKAAGFGIYLCSNASMRLPEIYEWLIPAVDCFDGILFSAPEKCMKPQKEIYERLFTRFDLKPEECFFIDDVQMNIDGGKVCGMDGYCFADGDIAKLKAALEQVTGKKIF
jgi:putative hydrolase of the HAD superfamily